MLIGIGFYFQLKWYGVILQEKERECKRAVCVCMYISGSTCLILISTNFIWLLVISYVYIFIGAKHHRKRNTYTLTKHRHNEVERNINLNGVKYWRSFFFSHSLHVSERCRPYYPFFEPKQTRSVKIEVYLFVPETRQRYGYERVKVQ